MTIECRSHPKQVARYIALIVSTSRPPPLSLFVVFSSQDRQTVSLFKKQLVRRISIVVPQGINDTPVHDTHLLLHTWGNTAECTFLQTYKHHALQVSLFCNRRFLTVEKLGALGIAFLHLLAFIGCRLHVAVCHGVYSSSGLHQKLTHLHVITGGGTMQGSPKTRSDVLLSCIAIMGKFTYSPWQK